MKESHVIENKQNVFFPNLDGLRFFCFLSVFLFHSFATHYDYIKYSHAYVFIKGRLLSNGELGVNFFFVLSGYLITYLLIKEKDFTGKIHITKFYARRILRIWPLYFVCVAFGFILFPVLKKLSGTPILETAHPIYYLAFLCNFDIIKSGPPVCSSLHLLWSLSVEEQFYLIWPLVLAILPIRYYKYVFFAVITISFVFRCFYYQLPEMQIHTLFCISDMAVGGLGAYYTFRQSKLLSSIKGISRYFIVFIYMAVAGIYFFRKEIFFHPFLAPFDRLVISIVFLFVILEQNFSANSIFKLGKNKILSKLGQYTYGLYCLQIIGIYITQEILNKLKLNTTLWRLIFIEGTLSLVITIILAYLSFTFFESFFLKLKRRFTYIAHE